MALRGGFYLAFIIDRYGEPETSLNIALPGGLYLATIMHRFGGTKVPLL
jgi:hypothetical protein